MLSFYLKYAVRSLRRKRLFSALNVAGLAIGITIFFLGLEYFQFEKGFNTFHPKLSQLYRVVISSAEGKTGASFPALAPLMERQIPGVRRAIRFGDNFSDGSIISWQPKAPAQLRSFRENGCVYVDPAFLDAFHFPLIEGVSRLDLPQTTVITASTAARLFGQERAVGKIIRLHSQFGDLPLTVTGVIADIPDQSDIHFALLLPIRVLDDSVYAKGSDWAKLTTWGNDAYTTYCWLDPAADPSAVAIQATKIWQHTDPDYAKTKGSILLQPVADMHMGKAWKTGEPTFASYGLTYTVLLLSILVLAIAWVNYINFATADALTRAREIGIHKAIGSSRLQIVARGLTEALLLNLLSLGLALSLSSIVQDLFNYITQRPLSLHYLQNAHSWMILLPVLGTGMLAGGAYTGLLLSRLQPVTALSFNAPNRVGQGLLRKGLVVFQLTISCVFIAVTLVSWQQIKFMEHHDLGMQIDRLVVIEGPVLRDSSFRSRVAAFRNDIKSLPFVEAFSSSGSAPGIGSGHNYSVDRIPGSFKRPGDEHTEYFISEVDEQYFHTYGIQLIHGTGFTSTDADMAYKGDKLIVNEKAARILGYDPARAVGSTIHWGKTYTIAAVVSDYHHRSLKDPIEPIIFVAQHNNSCYTIKTAPEGLPAKMATIQKIYEKAYPGNSFVWFPVHEHYDRQYADEERTGVVALCLSMLVIAISGLGLVGLAAFTARRRTKEMGIRKVLGASVFSLFSLLSTEYLWLVALALALGTPLSWLISHRWLETFAYRAQPGWTIWALTGLCCMGFTLLTVSVHALRTAFVNVVQQLRTE